MPRNPLIERYYEKVKEKYPHLKEDEFHAIVNHPFKYFRSKMVDPDLPDIRIKGFGSFQVYATPVLNAIKKHEKEILRKTEKGTLKDNDSNIERLKMLEDYVKENPTLFKKINERKGKSE